MRHTGNWILDRLPASEFARIKPYLVEEALRSKRTLQKHGTVVESAYFPTSGMISLVAVMRDGAQVEVGLVGRRGMLGIPLVLGDEISAHDAEVQIPGAALCMPASALRNAIEISPKLQKILLRYGHALLIAAAQSAACNSSHVLERRLARWLLAASDCTGSKVLPLSHEYISMMLGVRRAGVTVAAQSLHAAGLIEYAHGRMTVVNRHALEASACECYAVIKRHYDRLLGIPGEPEISDSVLGELEPEPG